MAVGERSRTRWAHDGEHLAGRGRARDVAQDGQLVRADALEPAVALQRLVHLDVEVDPVQLDPTRGAAGRAAAIRSRQVLDGARMMVAVRLVADSKQPGSGRCAGGPRGHRPRTFPLVEVLITPASSGADSAMARRSLVQQLACL